MDAKLDLGKEILQAINARRIIAKALCSQGPTRRAEADALLAEISQIVEVVGGGQVKCLP